MRPTMSSPPYSGQVPAMTTAELSAGDLAPSRSERPRNVFLVANNVEGVGGLQRVAHNLAQELSRSGHRVVLVALNHHDDRVTYVSDPLYETVTVYESPEPKPLPRTSRLRSLSPLRRRYESRRRRTRSEAVARLSTLFRSVPDGIVICMQIHVMAWVAQADTSHLRVIGQSHEQYEASRGWTSASRGVTRRYDGILRHYSDIDLFQLLTEVDARKFEQDGLNNVAVMHNPLSFYPPVAADLTAKTVITVGRYEPQKDQRALIAAFAQVAEQHPDWSLELWGTGPLQDALAEQIATLGLADNVRLMGATDDVASALLRSSVFALSSDFEGLPVVLCEAMACGVPCVSVDCGPGIAEIIRHDEDGLIVAPGDTDALAAALLRLIEDEPLRRAMGERARQNIRRFSVPEITRQWEAVFDMVER
jgi:glycosyltransferase involved in cell wall biosynthesis